jgi:hypothetical protein
MHKAGGGMTTPKLMTAVAGLVILCFLAAWVWDGEKRRSIGAEYIRRVRPRLEVSMRVLKGHPPQGVDPRAWEQANQVLYQMSYNCQPDGTERGIEAIEDVCDDLEKRLAAGEFGPETLTWLWERMAQTSDRGRLYDRVDGGEFKKAIRACADSLPERTAIP